MHPKHRFIPERPPYNVFVRANFNLKVHFFHAGSMLFAGRGAYDFARSIW